MRSVRGSSKGWSKLKAKKKAAPQPTYVPLPCYGKVRKDSLLSIGYSCYKEYLKSAEWVKIREDHLARHPHCILCQALASQVHHLSYDPVTLVGGHPDRLVQMCNKCHEFIEIAASGRKHSVNEANYTLFKKALEREDRAKRWAEGMLSKQWLKKMRLSFKKQGLFGKQPS